MNTQTDFIVLDLTSHAPHWVDAEGGSGPICPVFCLPVHQGERPLTAEAARVHRRGTSSSVHPSESYLDLANRSRLHLAEGWLRLSRDPDSLRQASTEFEWAPPGQEKIISTNFEEVLFEIVSLFISRTPIIGLVIPGRLGPGPQQQILDRLRFLPPHVAVHLIPRPIAIALDWLEGNATSVPIEGLGKGVRAGEMLVTSASSDSWEFAIVPLRVEEREGEKTVCPVHDRTRPQGDDSVVGLAWEMAARAGGSANDRLRAMLTNPNQPGESSPTKEIYDECLDPNLVPATEHAERRPPINEFLQTVKAMEPIVWVHSGLLEEGRVPKWIMANSPKCSPAVQQSSEMCAARGAGIALALLGKGMPPYYSALSPLELYVHGRNEYQDPVPEWLPLIEAAEVPAGEEYCSPTPIRGLQLQAYSDDDIELFLKLKRSGVESKRKGLAPVTAVLGKPAELEVEARMQPGRGLATVEIRSLEKGLFSSYLRLNQLEECSALPELHFSWPPGSGCIVSTEDCVGDALRPLRSFIAKAKHSFPENDLFSKLRDNLNKWETPDRRAYGQRRDLESYKASIDIPCDVHQSFIYVGAIPSGNNPFLPPMGELTAELATTLVDLLEKARGSDDKEKIFLLASWLYLSCPEVLLDEVRDCLSSKKPASRAMVACAGQCFSTEEDFRIFFNRFSKEVRGANRRRLRPDYWLRAYRNLARFRPTSLQTNVLSRTDQEDILDWYLEVFDRASPGNRDPDLIHSAYLAPQILKRRRYDKHFLEGGQDDYVRFDGILKWAEEKAQSAKHRGNAAVAREFLSKKATQSAIENLTRVEG